jgi:hypothetical protein
MKLVSIGGDQASALSCEISIDDKLQCEAENRNKLTVDLSFLNLDREIWVHFVLSGSK